MLPAPRAGAAPAHLAPALVARAARAARAPAPAAAASEGERRRGAASGSGARLAACGALAWGCSQARSRASRAAPRTRAAASLLQEAARRAPGGRDPEEAELAAALEELRAGLPAGHAFRENAGALRRFLVARKLDAARAREMLDKHAAWREENLPVRLTPEILAELRKGKFYLLPGGKDVYGHPVVVVRSGLFDPKERDLDTCIKAFLYVLETGLEDIGEDGKFSIMYDREGFSVTQNFDFDLLKAWAGIASDNYPERLASVALYPSGAVLAGLFKVVSVFFDPRTRAKIKMVQNEKELAELIPKEALPPRYGGTSTYEFDADAVYGSALVSA